MVADQSRMRLPPKPWRRWRRFVTQLWAAYVDVMNAAMRDASRSSTFAAQWPRVRDVAVEDMNLELLLSDMMPPEKAGG